MDRNIRIHLDKLPIKRLEAIEENGSERFPPEIGPDEKRIDQIRRIDFSFVVERDKKKAKTSKETTQLAATPWPWQGLVENLQSAHQELSVIVDLINTVEANDAVSVAGMMRPKLLPNEALSDLSVSTATKLQRLRHLGNYFKQSSKALEQQVARETRFYGALIRLQQNWKVKRQRLAAPSGGDDFVIDLLDNSFSDTAVLTRSTSMSTVRIDRSSSGMLTIQIPSKSCRFLHFGFLGSGTSHSQSHSSHNKLHDMSSYHTPGGNKEAPNGEDMNECVRQSHSFLREIHQAIFDEQVFESANRETLYQSPGVNVISMQEDLLQLGIGQDASIFLHLSSAIQDDSESQIPPDQPNSGEAAALQSDSLQLVRVDEVKNNIRHKFPKSDCFLIYLQTLLLENVFTKSKEKRLATKLSVGGQASTNGPGLLGHFCMSIAHRLYSNKVLAELENLASGVSYIHLVTHPTWNSRISSWSLYVIVPQLALHAGRQTVLANKKGNKNGGSLHFHTKVLVTDECINIAGEGAPNVIGSYGPTDLRPLNCYGCDLSDLPTVLLQQVTSQIVHWLHEEALLVGMKAIRDYLGLYFELEEGNKVGLVAHIDPDDKHGCISWWLVMDDASVDEGKSQGNLIGIENRKYLGHLSLEELYSILMDLVSLCSSGCNS